MDIRPLERKIAFHSVSTKCRGRLEQLGACTKGRRRELETRICDESVRFSCFLVNESPILYHIMYNGTHREFVFNKEIGMIPEGNPLRSCRLRI